MFCGIFEKREPEEPVRTKALRLLQELPGAWSYTICTASPYLLFLHNSALERSHAVSGYKADEFWQEAYDLMDDIINPEIALEPPSAH